MYYYQKIEENIDAFIKKYHAILCLQGLFQFLFFTLLSYISFSFAEYFIYFNGSIRLVFLIAFILISIFLLIKNVVIPGLYYFNLLKQISKPQAITILRKYFSAAEMNQLQSALELKELNDQNEAFILAAIEQKAASLKALKFSQAIYFNWKYLYFLLFLPLFLSFISVWLFSPEVFKDANTRIVNYDTFYQPEAYFQFHILNQDLNSEQGQSFTLNVQLQGARIPNKLYFIRNGKKYVMKSTGIDTYQMTINPIESSFDFQLFADNYYSPAYQIKCLSVPVQKNAFISVNPPAYTHLESYQTNNLNITIPFGSKITWNIDFMYDVVFQLNGFKNPFQQNKNKINWSTQVQKSFPYSYTSTSLDGISIKSPQYYVEVTPDLYPKIQLSYTLDSSQNNHFIITGSIDDDYGFHSLMIYYRNDVNKAYISKNIDFSKALNAQEFYYYLDASIFEDGNLEWYIEVRDNDPIQGYKRTLSQVFKNKIQNKRSIKENIGAQSESIQQKLEQSLKESKSLKEAFDQLKKDAQKQKKEDWQQQEALQDLLKKQQELAKNLEEIKKSNQEKIDALEQFEENKELLEKQKELQRLLDELMNDELKSMMDELSKLMDDMDQESLKEDAQELKEENAKLEDQLDRALELYKRMEVEQKALDLAENMKDLAEKLQEAADENRKDQDSEEGQKQQEDLQKEYDALKEAIEELKEKNEALEESLSLENPDTESTDQEMQEAGDALEKDKSKKAADAQQKAAESLEKMADALSESMTSSQEQQQGEDLESLRQVLDNLLVLSFKQEAIKKQTQVLEADDPLLNDLAKDQKNILDYKQIVEDSLRNLAKRVVQISSVINEHLNGIDVNIGQSLNAYHEREIHLLEVYQQKTMMHFNELANLLDDAMQQMQQQMQSQKSGNGSCNKPGGTGSGSPKMPSLKEMQDALSKKLEALKKQLEQQKGNQPGSQGAPMPLPIPGKSKGKSLSQELSETAKQQSEIKKKLMQLRDEQSGNKELKQQLDRIIDDIEENEKDLYQKNIDQQTIFRQQEILIKMLEAENAEREQGEDEKRESNSGSQKNATEQKLLELYLEKRRKEIEQKKSIDPTLKPYYQQKSQQYFEQKNNDGNQY